MFEEVIDPLHGRVHALSCEIIEAETDEQTTTSALGGQRVHRTLHEQIGGQLKRRARNIIFQIRSTYTDWITQRQYRSYLLPRETTHIL